MRCLRFSYLLPALLVFAFQVGCNPTVEDPAEAGSAETNAAGDEETESDDDQIADEASMPRDDANAIVIDVRTPAEWETGHVATAAHIPHTEIADRIAEVTDDKAANIVLYCKSGGRAGMAKKTLEELGYTRVENAGGFDDIKDRFAPADNK